MYLHLYLFVVKLILSYLMRFIEVQGSGYNGPN